MPATARPPTLKELDAYEKAHAQQLTTLIRKASALDWLEKHHKGYKIYHSEQKVWRIWKGHLLEVQDEQTLLSAIEQAQLNKGK